MSGPASAEELKKFLAANGDIERIEALFPTINNVYRGKWVPVGDAAKLTERQLRLPVSTYALDSWGIDVPATGLGVVSGDPDGIGVPVSGTITRIPWAKQPAAQVLMSMDLADETPCPYDPRQQLAKALGLFKNKGLTPVVAIELEFYLLAGDDPPRPAVTTPQGNLTNLDHMLAFEGVLADIHRCCEAQAVLAQVTLAEAGQGQFEINFAHLPDALRAADQAVLFKRIVKGCANKHGLRATFMAKPFGNDMGSGAHVHVSLVDGDGVNVFADGEPANPNPALHHAIAGVLETMRLLQAIFAPNLNSYRRFQPDSFAPSAVQWGFDHRAAAVRVPAACGPSARLEHRLAGADANPHLAVAAILAGMFHGMENELEPGPPIEQGAGDPPPLHHDWLSAVEDFAASKIAKATFGERFHFVYTALRRHEIATLGRKVTDVELELYLDGT